MNNSKYKQNKADAVTFNTEPTMTDQSQAEQTDINIIVTQFLRTGQAAQGHRPPIYADFAQLPEDLRGFIEMGRSIKGLQESLPDALKQIPVDHLVNLTNEQLVAILNPPSTQTDTQGNNNEDLRDQGQTDQLLHATVRGTRRQKRPGERSQAGEPGGDDE